QNAAVALPLEIAADGDEAKARLDGADEVDAHRSYDLAVAEEHVRKMAGLELIRGVLVVGLTRQQSGEDRGPANGVIGAPLLRRLYRPQRIRCETPGVEAQRIRPINCGKTRDVGRKRCDCGSVPGRAAR